MFRTNYEIGCFFGIINFVLFNFCPLFFLPNYVKIRLTVRAFSKSVLFWKADSSFDIVNEVKGNGV